MRVVELSVHMCGQKVLDKLLGVGGGGWVLQQLYDVRALSLEISGAFGNLLLITLSLCLVNRVSIIRMWTV